MLAGARVLDRCRLRARFEVGLGCVRLREQRPDDLELLGPGEMRGARDRDLAVVEIGTRADERERLDRLGGGAEEDEQPRIAGLGNDLPVADGDGVHGVHRLDDAAADHLDLDRIGHSRETTHGSMPELPEVEAWVRELDPLVSRAPIERAGPAHIATVKTFDPPLRALEGRSFAGARRRGKNLALPDRRRRARAPRPPDERRPAALPRARGEDAEDADVPAHVRRRRRARAHRGAARRSARASGCSRPRASRRSSRISARTRSASGRSGSPRSSARERRQLHPLLRDQRALAGIGRAHANEILWLAKLSPFKLSTDLSADETARLAAAIDDDLSRALALREAGKGDAAVYRIHGHFGEPCPLGHDTLRRVAFEEHTITYCPTCQTGGKELKDRRLSRLLR